MVQFNILKVFDFVIEGPVCMRVNECFNPLTLDNVLRNASRLDLQTSGFIIGQVFEGLKYLHEQPIVHGNLDPRSILVRDRNNPFIKIMDIALSEDVNLGKPEGYHDRYSSPNTGEIDQSPRDIWSAGVVSLELPHSDLPERKNINRQKLIESYVKRLSQKQPYNEGIQFLTQVLKGSIDDLPTAKDLLDNPWIQETKTWGYQEYLSVSSLATPQGSRHTSVTPFSNPLLNRSISPHSLRYSGGIPIKSRHTSRDSSCHSSKYGSVISSTNVTDRLHSTPFYVRKDGTTYIRESLIPTRYNFHNKTNVPGRAGPVRSQPSSEGRIKPEDKMRGSTGPGHQQRDVEIKEDGGEETETDQRREHVAKRTRRPVMVPPLEINLRSGKHGRH